nr:calmodulin binding protein PICBP-like [Tanacetum cinerariifolium]
MVQRKVPNKLSIKPYNLISDTHLVNLRPLSPQSHDLKKIMKKPRPVKRVDESRSSSPPLKKKKTQPVHDDGARSTPNYMKSTSCFEARKEKSPKTATPKVARKLKTDDLASGNKGSRTSSLKKVRTLTKTTSFKPSRPLKKVILCEDLDAQRATCSSTLKESKFPDYLQLNHGGTESEGTSAMKVCPYTYCSLNGHHHAPLPPLKCFLSAKRRALKTQKSLKVGCLSPRQRTPIVKKDDVQEPVIVAKEAPQKVDMEEENRDFFLEIYSKDREEKGNQDLECLDIDWEEGYCSTLFSDDCGDLCKEKNQKTGDNRLYSELQQLYDEETVTSGAWSEEDGGSESDNCYYKDHDFQNYDESEVSSTTTVSNENDKMNEIRGLDLLIGEKNIEYCKDDEWCEDELSWNGSDGEPDPSSDLDREWQRRKKQFHSIGYRDGLIAGKEASAQGFNVRFKESVVVGYDWGLVRGVTGALNCLPGELREKIIESQETKTKFHNLYESVNNLSTTDALKLYNDDLSERRV